MLSYERRVVASLLTGADPDRAASVTGFVAGSLGAMPEHLRLGISAISVGLGAWSALRRTVGLGRSGEAEVAWLEEHPVGLVRQWLRALRSLVTFAEQESLADAEVAVAGA